MKKLAIAALLSAQLATAVQPAVAADLAVTQETRAGTFGGLRLRVPLGGPRTERVRAGLAFAPIRQTRGSDGSSHSRIGEGLEFGYRSGRPLSFSLAGQDLNGRRFGAAQGNGRRNDAVPRIVLGVLAVGATLGLIYWGFSEMLDCDDGDDCS
jgi:opacity protein-like surface antigen